MNDFEQVWKVEMASCVVKNLNVPLARLINTSGKWQFWRLIPVETSFTNLQLIYTELTKEIWTFQNHSCKKSFCVQIFFAEVLVVMCTFNRKTKKN